MGVIMYGFAPSFFTFACCSPSSISVCCLFGSGPGGKTQQPAYRSAYRRRQARQTSLLCPLSCPKHCLRFWEKNWQPSRTHQHSHSTGPMKIKIRAARKASEMAKIRASAPQCRLTGARTVPGKALDGQAWLYGQPCHSCLLLLHHGPNGSSA